MEGHFTIDERRWREKLRKFEHENRKLKEDLARYLGHAVPNEQDNALMAKITELEAVNLAQKDEIKELKDKIKGLNMQLGRYKNKEK